MANFPSRRWTVLDVLSSVRDLAKTSEQRRVLSEQGKYFYKIALSEIVALLSNSQDPGYFSSTTLTVAADQERLKDSTNSGGVITAIDAVSDTISRSSGSFPTGSILHITIISSGATITSQWVARVTVGGSTASYTVISGTDATLSPTDRCSVIVVKSLSSATADISGVNYDRIIAINDDSAGACIQVSPDEFFSISRASFESKSYDDDIIWMQMGNTIHFRNGSKVTPGVKTMFYQRQPDYPTDFNDLEYPDLADKFIPLLIKRIYTYMILQSENDIPQNLAQEMQLDYAAVSRVAQSELENRFKFGKSVMDAERFPGLLRQNR